MRELQLQPENVFFLIFFLDLIYRWGLKLNSWNGIFILKLQGKKFNFQPKVNSYFFFYSTNDDNDDDDAMMIGIAQLYLKSNTPEGKPDFSLGPHQYAKSSAWFWNNFL